MIIAGLLTLIVCIIGAVVYLALTGFGKRIAFAMGLHALERRIRHLVKGEGLSIAKAVRQAQEDTGVKLTEQGTAMLIQVLEEESEKMSALGIETVSDEEYEKLTGQKVKPS
jgi:hypothetical protein